MMLWVNLIMDTMGALALGTEPPSPTLLNRRPYQRDAPLISNLMWRNVILQTLFQIGVLAYLLMIGASVSGLPKVDLFKTIPYYMLCLIIGLQCGAFVQRAFYNSLQYFCFLPGNA